MELEHVILPDESQHGATSYNGLDAATLEASEARGYYAKPSPREELPRPASYTNIPRHQEHSEPSFSFSEDDLVPSKTSWSGTARKDDYHSPFQKQERRQSPSNIYSKSPDAPSDSRITVQRTLLVQGQGSQQGPQSPTSDDVEGTRALPSRIQQKEESATAPTSDVEVIPKAKLSKSLSFGRKGKVARSDSRSPEKAQDGGSEGQSSKTTRTSAASRAGKFFSWENNSKSGKPDDSNVKNKEDKAPKRSLSRGRSMLGRKSAKAQQSTPKEPQLPDTSLDGGVSNNKRPVTPVTKSFSNPSITQIAGSKEVNGNVPPLPDKIPVEKLTTFKERSSKKKDELWSVFRALESDYSKFHSKSLALKANVIRSTLLPFLRDFVHHPSNANLRLEDLDRRANILNKWWTGLLDLLQGKNSNSLSGSDRPVILDAMAGIMERIEWRYPPSPFSSIEDRNKGFQYTRTESTASAGSEDFLLESVHHNVRNAFVQNLFGQMVYVVDKMSLKHAPASLVSFCGKACAYAFFFCPGIAEVLVRLWGVTPHSLHKVMRVSGVQTTTSLEASAELARMNFPSCLHSLIFTSVKSIVKELRHPPVLPLGVDKIEWEGHWLTRWSGRDSELLFVFLHHYHVLLLNFLPPEPTVEERISAPGLVVILAQMLSNLESTIHRQSTLAGASSAGPDATVTFEDLLNADSPAAAIPSSPMNATRIMSENRLVLVLKDLVNNKTQPRPTVAGLFVTSFCDIVQAAIRSTSLYDQAACFTLCDFLQEALVILIPLQSQGSLGKLPLEWPFITNVFRRMIASQNTTTEIRLYSMIFSIWESITEAEAWRDQLCFDFLLQRDHFLATFNHWCPMVRAYYMRLICWRLSRYDGDASKSDVRILQTLKQRLQEVWAYYKHLDSSMRKDGKLRPSTAPCNPAPGRKLLIIRTDTQVPTPLLSFNNMLEAAENSWSNKSSPTESSYGNSAPSSSLLEKVSATLEYGVDVSRRRSSLFRSLWGSRSNEPSPRSESPKQDDSPTASPHKSKAGSRGASPDRGDSRSSMYEQRPSQLSIDTDTKDVKSSAQVKTPRHAQADFKFSLEAVDRRPHTIPTDMSLEPPRLPLAAELLLQSISDGEKKKEEGEEEERDTPSEFASPIRYAGRALAEWTWVVNECQNFFERRRSEGVPSNRLVECPELGVEPFRRPG